MTPRFYVTEGTRVNRQDGAGYGIGRTTAYHFSEPVNKFTVHIDGDLAFVKADANFIVDGELRSNNPDYFTLIRADGAWKFVNISYVTKAPEQK
jgi:hypothetical protein